MGGVDTVAGITYSSKAFKDAITDAFNTLINSGLLAAGEKSEEQLIGEAMPLALPGCVNGTGACVVEEAEASDTSITAAYRSSIVAILRDILFDFYVQLLGCSSICLHRADY